MTPLGTNLVLFQPQLSVHVPFRSSIFPGSPWHICCHSGIGNFGVSHSIRFCPNSSALPLDINMARLQSRSWTLLGLPETSIQTLATIGPWSRHDPWQQYGPDITMASVGNTVLSHKPVPHYCWLSSSTSLCRAQTVLPLSPISPQPHTC